MANPAALAAEPVSEALKAWGRLGYPRRALRLHAAATVITDEFDGEVPATQEGLLALPGVGTYTAAAIACFAFNVPAVVVDTNIRRVHARLVSGQALPEQSQTAGELALAARLMPTVSSSAGADARLANAWNIAVMELGALVCTARSPVVRIARSSISVRGSPRGDPNLITSPRGSPGTAPTGRCVEP